MMDFSAFGCGQGHHCRVERNTRDDGEDAEQGESEGACEDLKGSCRHETEGEQGDRDGEEREVGGTRIEAPQAPSKGRSELQVGGVMGTRLEAIEAELAAIGLFAFEGVVEDGAARDVLRAAIAGVGGARRRTDPGFGDDLEGARPERGLSPDDRADRGAGTTLRAGRGAREPSLRRPNPGAGAPKRPGSPPS